MIATSPAGAQECRLTALDFGDEIYSCCQAQCDDEGEICMTICDDVTIEASLVLPVEVAKLRFQSMLASAEPDRPAVDPDQVADDYKPKDQGPLEAVVCCNGCTADNTSCDGCVDIQYGGTVSCDTGAGVYMVCGEQDWSGDSCGGDDVGCWTNCSRPRIS